jgi:transcriptional regulator with XRE-family HTH domain
VPDEQRHRTDARDPSGRLALRSARTARGWSQSRAAAELHALAVRRGGPDAAPASLKTQLSRWENGHALPEPEYRELLAELYGLPAADLGLVPRGAAPAPGPSSADVLRAELGAAAAVGPAVLREWAVQLGAARRLDDELGAAGAGEVGAALAAQLARTLAHSAGRAQRVAVAELLAGAAALAGRHALDRDDSAAAWSLYAAARAAAAECGSAAALAEAAEGLAEVLRAVGSPQAAADLLAEVAAECPGSTAAVRLAAARGVTWAALGRAAAAEDAFTEARAGLAAIDAAHPRDGYDVELVDVDRWHGHALVALHDPGAVAPLESALAGTHPVRHRAVLHADLARTHAAAGRAGPAARHARDARRLAELIGARPVVAALRLTDLPPSDQDPDRHRRGDALPVHGAPG